MILRLLAHDSPVSFANTQACHLTHEPDPPQKASGCGFTADLLLVFLLTVVTCQSSAAPDIIQVMSPETLNQVTDGAKTELLAENNSAIRPFEINVDEAAIQDLHARLALTRLPDQIPGSSWEYGTELRYLEELLDYWQSDFDWPAHQDALNKFDHYKTILDAIDLHFIHQKSDRADAIPLLLVHGWPGSISEFQKIIPTLTNPELYGGNTSDSFHVIAPSLPGFGFSSAPETPGFGPE